MKNERSQIAHLSHIFIHIPISEFLDLKKVINQINIISMSRYVMIHQVSLRPLHSISCTVVKNCFLLSYTQMLKKTLTTPLNFHLLVLNLWFEIFCYPVWISAPLTPQFSRSVCLTVCNPMDCSTPGFPVHHEIPKCAQTHIYRVSDAIQPSCPLSSPSPPAFNFSQHEVFANESVLQIRWPKYWSFSFSISPSNEYSGLISFRMNWLDLPAVQGILKSLL